MTVSAPRGLNVPANCRSSSFKNARDPLGTAPSTCHSFSPDVWQQADRAHGTVRDFSERPDALLAEPLRP